MGALGLGGLGGAGGRIDGPLPVMPGVGISLTSGNGLTVEGPIEANVPGT